MFSSNEVQMHRAVSFQDLFHGQAACSYLIIVNRWETPDLQYVLHSQAPRAAGSYLDGVTRWPSACNNIIRKVGTWDLSWGAQFMHVFALGLVEASLETSLLLP